MTNNFQTDFQTIYTNLTECRHKSSWDYQYNISSLFISTWGTGSGTQAFITEEGHTSEVMTGCLRGNRLTFLRLKALSSSFSTAWMFLTLIMQRASFPGKQKSFCQIQVKNNIQWQSQALTTYFRQFVCVKQCAPFKMRRRRRWRWINAALGSVNHGARDIFIFWVISERQSLIPGSNNGFFFPVEINICQLASSVLQTIEFVDFSQTKQQVSSQKKTINLASIAVKMFT